MIISKSRVKGGASKKEVRRSQARRQARSCSCALTRVALTTLRAVLQVKPADKKAPELDQLLEARDYSGASALLSWRRSSGAADVRAYACLPACLPTCLPADSSPSTGPVVLPTQADHKQYLCTCCRHSKGFCWAGPAHTHPGLF
jgi:hypothetical protein